MQTHLLSWGRLLRIIGHPYVESWMWAFYFAVLSDILQRGLALLPQWRNSLMKQNMTSLKISRLMHRQVVREWGIVRFQRICHEFKFRGASPLRDHAERRVVPQRRRDTPLNLVTYPLETDYSCLSRPLYPNLVVRIPPTRFFSSVKQELEKLHLLMPSLIISTLGR